jgi:replicative DNA helicase
MTTQTKHTPRSLEAEMSLLGSLLLDPAAFLRTLPIVDGRDVFYDERHGDIYEAAKHVYNVNRGGDLVQIMDRLRDLGRLDAVGGVDYIESLAASCPAATNADHYAKIVREKYLLRRLVNTCADVSHKAHTDAANNTADALCARLVREVTDIIRNRDDSTALADAADELMIALDSGKRMGVEVGIEALDNQIGGIPGVGVTSLLGAPGSGKSSWMLKMITSLAKGGRPVCVFSYEMGPVALATNIMASEAHENVSLLLRTGERPALDVWNKLRSVQQRLAQLPIRFVRERMTAERMYQRAMVEAAQGVSVFVIDYIQGVPGRPGQESVARVEEACRTAQAMAIDNNAIVILVSQITQAAAREDRQPGPSDCVGGGAIDQVSDMTISVYRPARLNPRRDDDTNDTWEKRKRQMVLEVCKNKQGATGAFEVVFRPEWTAILDAEFDAGPLGEKK